jgi:hypothetical protein
MSDYISNSPQPTDTTDQRQRRALIACVLAAIVAMCVALAVVLANSRSHGSSAAAKSATQAPTSSAASATASTPAPGPTTTSSRGGGSGGEVAGSGGGVLGSGGGPSGGPFRGRTTPPVTIPNFDLHAFPTGPPSVDESACPAHLSFAAVISAQRGPVTVTYRWVRSDGAHSPVGHVNFPGTGPQLHTVFSTWDLGSDYAGSEQLQVLTPTFTTAAVMPFSVHCAPTVAISSVWAAPAAGTCDSLATTLHATVTIARAPVQVRYHWVIDGHAYPIQALPGIAVADHTISDPFTFSTPVHGRSLHPVRLILDDPYAVTSSASYMGVDCA